jgi:hypothetical protein
MATDFIIVGGRLTPPLHPRGGHRMGFLTWGDYPAHEFQPWFVREVCQ